jgi:hypothetical protein
MEVKRSIETTYLVDMVAVESFVVLLEDSEVGTRFGEATKHQCGEVASLINDIPNSNRWWKKTLTYCMAVDITIEESHLTTKDGFEEAFLRHFTCVVLNEAHLFDPDPVGLPTAEDAMDTARAICDEANLSTQTNFRQKLWSVRRAIGRSSRVSRRAFLRMAHDRAPRGTSSVGNSHAVGLSEHEQT